MHKIHGLKKLHSLLLSPFILTFFLTMFTSCKHNDEPVEFGLVSAHSSYIPARIAVTECRKWPNGARFQSLATWSPEDGDFEALCGKFDQFVLNGFADQPYMRGMSPKVVDKLISLALSENGSQETKNTDSQKPTVDVELVVPPKNDPTQDSQLVTEIKEVNAKEKPRFMDQIETLWHHLPTDCSNCSLSPEFYVRSISQRPEWLLWLSTFSKYTKNSDAILIPFITFINSARFNDRGQEIAQKRAGIAMLLIDTNSGNLLWSGGRQTLTANRDLAKKGTQQPSLPSWEDLVPQLFTEDVWKDFPGRQVYH